MTERYDFHVHTRLSPCAQPEMRIDAILRQCVGNGVKYLGITDHIGASTDPDILVEVRSELERFQAPMLTFVGCEADVLAVGKHAVTEDVKSRVDFIAVAANHFHLPTVAQPDEMSPRGLARHYLEMFSYACTLGFADVIVHPMTVLLDTYEPEFLELIEDDQLIEPIENARDNGIAMEISPRALLPNQIAFRMRFLRLCKRIGVKFSIGSDAHRLRQVGCGALMQGLVNELGITESDIWLPGDSDSERQASDCQSVPEAI